jgi:hypothetical protein
MYKSVKNKFKNKNSIMSTNYSQIKNFKYDNYNNYNNNICLTENSTQNYFKKRALQLSINTDYSNTYLHTNSNVSNIISPIAKINNVKFENLIKIKKGYSKSHFKIQLHSPIKNRIYENDINDKYKLKFKNKPGTTLNKASNYFNIHDFYYK